MSAWYTIRDGPYTLPVLSDWSSNVENPLRRERLVWFSPLVTGHLP